MLSELRLAPMLWAIWLATGLQYGRFLLVGVAATVVHVLVYAGAVEYLALRPLVANALRFAVAVQVSFFGHRRWTFRAASGSRGRFWAVAILGFAVNSLFVRLVTVNLGLAYYWAIPLIGGVTPVLTFTLSKLWAFRPLIATPESPCP